MTEFWQWFLIVGGGDFYHNYSRWGRTKNNWRKHWGVKMIDEKLIIYET